jgi:transposase
MPGFALSAKERRRLEECLRTTREVCAYRRALALLKVDRKMPVVEVARELFVAQSSVYRWVSEYAKTRDPATLADGRHGNGRKPRFWSNEAEKVLEEALQHGPDHWQYNAVNWTIPLLCEHIGNICGEKPSDRKVRHHLRELGYVWKRPRHALRESKSPRVLRRLRAIRKRVKNLPAGCARLFEDETDLLLFPPLRAGWYLRGKPAEVPISGENAKRTVFGTIDMDTGRRIFVARGGACAVDFQALLRLIRQGYRNQAVALLLDGASRHSADASEELAAECNIELIWLPARASNINPMDRLWKWGKDKICANMQYLSIDYQAERFIEYLFGLSAEEALRKGGLRSGRFWLFR